ncbi:hypothetical protein D3C80_1651320 [compost metagenome]
MILELTGLGLELLLQPGKFSRVFFLQVVLPVFTRSQLLDEHRGLFLGNDRCVRFVQIRCRHLRQAAIQHAFGLVGQIEAPGKANSIGQANLGRIDFRP